MFGIIVRLLPHLAVDDLNKKMFQSIQTCARYTEHKRLGIMNILLDIFLMKLCAQSSQPKISPKIFKAPGIVCSVYMDVRQHCIARRGLQQWSSGDNLTNMFPDIKIALRDMSFGFCVTYEVY